MQKKILILSLLACSLLSLSSCRKQKEEKIVQEEPDLVVFTPHAAEKTEAIIREFMAELPSLFRSSEVREPPMYSGAAELSPLSRLKTFLCLM